MARIKIGMSDEALIKWLQRVTESGQISSWTRKESNWKRCHVIQWNGVKAMPLLNAVRPYLRLKKRQADIMMEWVTIARITQQRLLLNDCDNRRFPPELLLKRDAMISELRRLNHRGLHAL